MGALQRIGRVVSVVVEVAGRTLEAFFGLGARSRSASARNEARRDTDLESLVRLHASGKISDREFEERKRRLRRT